MAIKVTFEFNSIEDAAAFLVSKGVVAAPAATVESTPEPVKVKRTRVARPETPVESAAPAKEIVIEKPVVTPPPVKAAPKAPNAPVQAVAGVTLEAARAALKDVFNAKGAAVATQILKDFGAARIGEVKPADYHKFILACTK